MNTQNCGVWASKGQATLCVQSAQYRTRSSEIAFLRTVLVWLSTCIPYRLNIVSDYAITQYRTNASEIAHLVRIVCSGLYAPDITEGWLEIDKHYSLELCFSIVVLEVPPLSPSVTVWCAMSSSDIIGPFFFEDVDVHTQTVNKERCVDILKRFWVALQRGSPGADRLRFQQNGATPHTTRVTVQWLEEQFGTRLISHGTDTPRPAHSPDLTPLDF